MEDFVISDVIREIAQEYYKYYSEQATRTTDIVRQTAILEARYKELQAHTELADKYFQGQIAERERLFQYANDALEKAIYIGDLQIAQYAITTIEIVHKKSPFSY